MRCTLLLVRSELGLGEGTGVHHTSACVGPKIEGSTVSNPVGPALDGKEDARELGIVSRSLKHARVHVLSNLLSPRLAARLCRSVKKVYVSTK